MSTYRLMDGQSGRPGVGSSGTQPPGSVTSYSGNYSAGLVFQVTEGSLYFEGYWWYVPTGGDASSVGNFALWQITGTNTGTFIPATEITWVGGAFTAGAWNFIPCTPVPLTPNIPYEAVISYSTTVGYPSTPNQFGNGEPYADGITNGPLSAYGYSTGSSSATTGDIPQSPSSEPANIDPGYYLPTGNNSNGLLWLDVQVTSQVPTQTPERAWPNMSTPWPTPAPLSAEKTLGMEFTLSRAGTLSKVWHYAPYPNTAGSFSAWGQSTVNTPAGGGTPGTYTFGTEFEVSSTCNVDTFWFYSAPSNVNALPLAVAIYEYGNTTPLELHNSPTWSGAAGSGWISTPMNGTTQVTSGTSYYMAAFGEGAWWSYNEYWGPSGTGVTSGPLSVPSAAGSQNGQGVINNSGATSIEYPNTEWSNYNAWMDISVSLATVGALPSQVAIWDTSTQDVVPKSLITNPTWHNPDSSTSVGPGWMYCDYSQSNISLPAGTYKVSTYSSSGDPWYAATGGVYSSGTISLVQEGNSYTFSNPITAGNTVFLVATCYDDENATLSTSAPLLQGQPVANAVKLQEVLGAWDASAGQIVLHSIWMLPNVPGGTTAFGLSVNGGGGMNSLQGYEVAGLGPSPVVDQQSSSSSITSATVDSTTTPATKFANEFILAAAAIYEGSGAGPTSGGWTDEEANSSGWSGYQISSSAGGTYDWQQTTVAGTAWTAGIVTVTAGTLLQASGFTQDILTIPSSGQASYFDGGWGYPNTTAGGEADWLDVEVIPSATASSFRFMDGVNGRPGNGPTTAQSYDSGGMVVGLTFEALQSNTWFEGYWYWVCPTGGLQQIQKFALWSEGAGHQTLVPNTTVTSSAALKSGWNYVPLPSPVLLSVSMPYTVATGVNGNFSMSSTVGVGTGAVDSFGTGGHSSGILNGPVFAYSDYGNGGIAANPYASPQGGFTTGGTDPSTNYPGGGSNSANFWIDAQVTTNPPYGYTGSYRAWPNSFYTSPYVSGDSEVNYVVGTEIRVSVPSTLNKIWYWSPSGTAQFATECAVWDIDSQAKVAENASPTWYAPDGTPATAGNGWCYVSFSGVTIPAGRYRIAIYNGAASPDSWSTKQVYYFNVGEIQATFPGQSVGSTGPQWSGISNGPLYVPSLSNASATDYYQATPDQGSPGPGQAVFAVGPPNAFPDLYVKGLGQNYWVDMEITPLGTNFNVLPTFLL